MAGVLAAEPAGESAVVLAGDVGDARPLGARDGAGRGVLTADAVLSPRLHHALSGSALCSRHGAHPVQAQRDLQMAYLVDFFAPRSLNLPALTCFATAMAPADGLVAAGLFRHVTMI